MPAGRRHPAAADLASGGCARSRRSPGAPILPPGVALGAAAYVCWGLFPLFFALLDHVGPVEVVAHRVLWSLVLCAGLLALGRLRTGRSAPLPWRQLPGLALAAALLAGNWGVFVHGVTSGQVVQTSLGYFVTPLVSVLLGVVVLSERLRPLQWAAVTLGAVAVVVLAVEDGRPPWIALTLAATFGLSGLVKKQVGRGVGALVGLTVETAVLAPVALAYVAVLALVGTPAAASGGLATPALLVASGPLTAGVLLLFAGAARRVRLSTIGLLQYVSPVLQLLCGVLVLGESLSPARLAGFAVVWAALGLLVADVLRTRRRAAGEVAATEQAAPAR